jgi:transposase
MLIDYSNVKNIFIVCGKSDLRKGIDGLAAIVSLEFNLDLFDDALFLFCGTRKDRYKALYFDQDGFLLLYKRIDKGRLQWPRDEKEVRKLTDQQLRWLLEGLAVEQPRAILPATKAPIA